MAFQVMNAERGNVERVRQAMGKRSADEERTGQARPFGVADALQVAELPARRVEYPAGKRRQAADVVAGGELGHHPAIGLVHRHLRMQRMRQQPPGRAVIQGDARLVARSLDAEDQHVSILIYNSAPFESGSSSGVMPTVRVKENEPFEVAMRRFKRTVEKTGLLTELRAREYYEKPTAERKRKLAAAVKRHHKRLRSQMLPQKMY